MCLNSELSDAWSFRIWIHLPRGTEDSARLVTRAEVGGAVTARGSLSRSSVRGRSGRSGPRPEVQWREMSAPKPTFRQAQRRVCCQRRLHPRTSPKRLRGIDMTEGLLGRILGGEAEKPQVEAPEALAGAAAFAAAA